jgi:hypothetical protein
VIPLATTTITITRQDPTVDGYAPTKSVTTVAAGVRAAITGPSGTTILTGGTRTEYTWVFNADPCDVKVADVVTDDATGTAYTVDWITARTGLGLDHVNGRLKLVQGAY